MNGFPADSVNYAFDSLDVKPHLVVTGINEGQNVGPLVDVSGTVGAARAAVAHGVPAARQQPGPREDVRLPDRRRVRHRSGSRSNRDELIDGSAEVQVTNMNIPSCDTGEVHGAQGGARRAPTARTPSSRRTARRRRRRRDDDVAAFNLGWVTISVVPDKPATATTTAAAG